MNLIVRPSGKLVLTTSKSTSRRAIKKFLESQVSWIEKVDRSHQGLRSRYPKKQFVDGEWFLFQGEELSLKKSYVGNKKVKWKRVGAELYLESSASSGSIESEELRQSLIKFYEKEGRKVLSQSVAIWAEKMSLFPTAVSYRSQKTRWGSCSSQGKISLNWRLVAAPKEVMEYVVIHELAHLKHQNHSRNFWALVESYCPAWKAHKVWLQQNQFEFDFLAKKSELHGNWDVGCLQDF